MLGDLGVLMEICSRGLNYQIILKKTKKILKKFQFMIQGIYICSITNETC